MNTADIYIVIDMSPRFQSILLTTFDKEEAEEFASLCRDRMIFQPSGKDFPSTLRHSHVL